MNSVFTSSALSLLDHAPVLPWLARLRQAGLRWRAAGSAWRDRAHERECLRALRALSDSTLQDIGLADRVLKLPAPVTMIEFERGLWLEVCLDAQRAA
jgi:uncharacterized protein YjiS (DUF1127 family)